MTVKLHNVSFMWPGQAKPLLSLRDFQVQAGEKVLLQGPSGSGKSTFLSLLTGVIQAQSGSIQLLDYRLESLTGPERDRVRADHVGYIFQLFNLLPYLSVRENVLLALRFSARKRAKVAALGKPAEQEADRLLLALGLDDPNLFLRPVSCLSIGQQQRVAAARAMIGQPEILIADEPTSALDSDAREAFLQLLFQECERAQTSLIYVSHDRGLGPLFDRSLSINALKESHLTKSTPQNSPQGKY